MNKSKKISYFFSFIIAFLFIANAVTANEKQQKGVSPSLKLGNIIYVDDNNTIGPWDGSLAHPYCTIGDGVRYTHSGDTVYVFSGFYQELLIVDKSITLQGENKQTTVLTNTFDIGFLITTQADNVTITGFNLENAGMFAGNRKICIESNFCTITDNILSDYTSLDCMGGIDLFGANHTVIQRNIIGLAQPFRPQTAAAILLNHSYNNLIRENTFGFYSVSIILFDSDSNIIEHNSISSCCTFIRSRNNSITQNNLSSNKALIFNNSDDNFIEYNNFGRHGFKEWKQVGKQIDFFDSSNIFDHNYWGRPRLFPKLIFGNKTVDGKSELAIEFDWHPAKTPNMIS